MEVDIMEVWKRERNIKKVEIDLVELLNSSGINPVDGLEFHKSQKIEVELNDEILEITLEGQPKQLER